MAGILTSSPHFKGLPAQTSHFTEKVTCFEYQGILFSLHQWAHSKGWWNQLIGLKIVLALFVLFFFLMHSFHLSAALSSPFECSSPTPDVKAQSTMETDLTEEIINHLKDLTFSAKTWDKNNVQLQTVQHPKLAATNSEPRISWRFYNSWRNQTATSQGGKKMQGNSDQSRYSLVQWVWLWWLCCMTHLC